MKRLGGVFGTDYGKVAALIKTKLQWGALASGLAIAFSLPLFAGDYILSVLNMMGIILVAVIGLNILTGYTGQFSLAQASFMGVGAYASGLFTVKLGIPFWLALPGAGLIAGLIGVLFGFPAVRVRGFYLALVTIAAQFIIVYTIYHVPALTGGSSGMAVPPPRIGSIVFNTEGSYYYVVLLMVVLMTLIAINIRRTATGRAFVAMKDNEMAAQAMGINIAYYKLLAFFICSVYAGIAGSLWGHYLLWLSPENITLMNSIWYLGMVIVGGIGSILGSFLGVLVLKILEEGIAHLAPLIAAIFPATGAVAFAALGQMVFGLVFILFLIFEPRGLAHRLELLLVSLRRYPFSE